MLNEAMDGATLSIHSRKARMVVRYPADLEVMIEHM
jgi:hypothetical protein